MWVFPRVSALGKEKRVQDFKKLRVWHASVDLAEVVYRATEGLPAAERYGLVAQMRSAVISISSNIAEGSGRRGGADTARFLQIAIGSASELECQVLVANRLGLIIESEPIAAGAESLRRQLIRLLDRVSE
jgi:four helix bundle protein